MISAVAGISMRSLALRYNPTFDEITGAARRGADMEPRAVERFSETMADEEHEPQTFTPYALDRTTGFYVHIWPRSPGSSSVLILH
jgi:hypothetical protein